MPIAEELENAVLAGRATSASQFILHPEDFSELRRAIVPLMSDVDAQRLTGLQPTFRSIRILTSTSVPLGTIFIVPLPSPLMPFSGEWLVQREGPLTADFSASTFLTSRPLTAAMQKAIMNLGPASQPKIRTLWEHLLLEWEDE